METLYGAFDALAKRRGVFKIETIGDSYVAVVGLPEPRKNHAVIMAKFAADIRDKMHVLTFDLEKTLGPGTGDLRLRIGIHSGPVTAGVLRGEKSRFQLFGGMWIKNISGLAAFYLELTCKFFSVFCTDTVNTAARMESNGQKGLIQASQKTADLLAAAGKGQWVTPRPDLVEAKGKGTIQTFWIEPRSSAGSVMTASSTGTGSSDTDEAAEFVALGLGNPDAKYQAKVQRLIDWNVELLARLLKNLVATRGPAKSSMIIDEEKFSVNDPTVRDEITESISMPDCETVIHDDVQDVELSTEVVLQLRSFITAIAHGYQTNAFHNFEHASHVTMATMKLLQRIQTPSSTMNEKELYESTYGIASDPLTQFTMMLAALIHDVDHPGGTFLPPCSVLFVRFLALIPFAPRWSHIISSTKSD